MQTTLQEVVVLLLSLVDIWGNRRMGHRVLSRVVLEAIVKAGFCTHMCLTLKPTFLASVLNKCLSYHLNELFIF